MIFINVMTRDLRRKLSSRRERERDSAKIKVRQKLYRESQPESIRTTQENHPPRDYHYGKGAQVHFVTQMLIQHSECAICEKQISARGRGGAYLDHNHNTGQWRGALCAGCNTLVGNIEKGEEMLRKAQAYIAAWKLRGEARNDQQGCERILERPTDGHGETVHALVFASRA